MEDIASDILQKHTQEHKINFHFVVDNSQCLRTSTKFNYKGLNKNDQFFIFLLFLLKFLLNSK